MEIVRYQTTENKGVTISITHCDRLAYGFKPYVGGTMCMGCSYCYDVNRDEKYVKCRKKLNGGKNAPTKEGEIKP